MIKLNDEIINVKHFPDGTVNFKFGEVDDLNDIRPNRISWNYENDSEMFIVYCLVNMIREVFPCAKIELEMPYLPNARMDRIKNNSEAFTLKYFAKFINDLNFETVFIYDIHSNVGNALIDRVVELYPYDNVEAVIRKHYIHTLYFPDEGSVKRYADKFDTPFVFGMKKRDWETGQILGLDVLGNAELIKGQDILIVDDICSRGGTFYHSAKKLKELGANKIYLYVTHCENTILEGILKDHWVEANKLEQTINDLMDSNLDNDSETVYKITGYNTIDEAYAGLKVLKKKAEFEYNLIEKVYTTDSIFTKEHEKIEVFKI